VKKMRGQPMSMGAFPFAISRAGIRVFTPELTLARMPPVEKADETRLATGVAGLDELLLGGIPRGRSVMLSGVSGSGKTTLGIQFLMEGAKRGERGIFYSFEETADRLITLAKSFGWDLARHLDEGTIRIVSIPVTDIRVDENLEDMIRDMQRHPPARVVLDSFSAFLAKVRDPAVQRDKAYHLVDLVHRAGAVAILISDVPTHEANRVSRFGVEETVVDGTIVLSTDLRGGKRVRYLEVYKMRTTDHVRGRHRMDIGSAGLRVFYKSPACRARVATPPPIALSSVEGVVEGDIPYSHTWLVRGGAGSGKSVWAIQYAVERLRSGEAVLFVATEASSRTVLAAMERLGLLTEPYVESGLLVVKSVDENHELDLEDPESFINLVAGWLDGMPKPCARVVDSLTPLMVGMSPEEFKAILTKGRMLSSSPGVSMLDTVMASSDVLQSYLTNHFDVVIDLYTPDWGDLKGADDRGRPVMRLLKARGVRVDTRPYPFRISRDGGVVVQKDFYGLQG
jgi:circadian clock protein KaiC